MSYENKEKISSNFTSNYTTDPLRRKLQPTSSYYRRYRLEKLKRVRFYFWRENWIIQVMLSHESWPTISGQMMMLGGSISPNLKSRTKYHSQSCGLTQVGDLPMNFAIGACNTFITSSGKEETMFCFGEMVKVHATGNHKYLKLVNLILVMTGRQS